jgi:hypothetical protein
MYESAAKISMSWIRSRRRNRKPQVVFVVVGDIETKSHAKFSRYLLLLNDPRTALTLRRRSTARHGEVVSKTQSALECAATRILHLDFRKSSSLWARADFLPSQMDVPARIESETGRRATVINKWSGDAHESARTAQVAA